MYNTEAHCFEHYDETILNLILDFEATWKPVLCNNRLIKFLCSTSLGLVCTY